MSVRATKPNLSAQLARESIRASKPLSIVSLKSDRMAWCNVCGMRPTEGLEVWRAHDEYDRPIAGDLALVFLGKGAAHRACHAKLDAHPRLFREEAGAPGHFPLLCGPCLHRDGLGCRHRDLTDNGGAGLKLEIDAMTGVLCFGRGRGGCQTILRHARSCVGRTLKERKGTDP